jgi:endonuclease YncB( thermonuclease family)
LAGQITGRVVGIGDGDTLTVLDDAQRQTKVRLAEIDSRRRGRHGAVFEPCRRRSARRHGIGVRPGGDDIPCENICR